MTSETFNRSSSSVEEKMLGTVEDAKLLSYTKAELQRQKENSKDRPGFQKNYEKQVKEDIEKGFPFVVYVEWLQSLNLARLCAQFDPENPTPVFAHRVRDAVVKKLAETRKLGAVIDSVKYYTTCSALKLGKLSVKTSADVHHGVDAFFVISLKNVPHDIFITMDITSNAFKGSTKSDVLVYIPFDFNGDSDEPNFAALVEQTANSVVRKAQSKSGVDSN